MGNIPDKRLQDYKKLAKKYQDEMARSIHEMAEGLYKIGEINADQMHEFDEGCLVHETSKINQSAVASPSTPRPALAAKKC
ncbi:MAG: hypothetical protein Ta2B_17800 [Termitinemataceae bacterium]|nr:MAG: hypothetical protein Ta2B_17800 [Termitinemataceae bacterium]